MQTLLKLCVVHSSNPISNMHVQTGLPPPEKNIDALENMQKFALKVCCKQWALSYENLLGLANIQSGGKSCVY